MTNAIQSFGQTRTGQTLVNSFEVFATYNPNRAVLPAGDSSLSRLFSFAVDPSNQMFAGNRGQLFEASQFAQADLNLRAYHGQALAELDRVDSQFPFFGNGRGAEKSAALTALSSSLSALGDLHSEFAARGLDQVVATNLRAPGMELRQSYFRGVEGLQAGLYPAYNGKGGLEFSPSPLDFGAGGIAVGLQHGARAGAAAIAEDFVSQYTIVSPSLRARYEAPIAFRRTNAELVGEIAKRAETKVGGTGRLAGIDKHTYAKKVLDRYQDMFGHRGLQSEVSVIGRKEVSYGRTGSVRLDVLEGSVTNPTAIFDYKFGTRGLSPSRINQIRNVTGYGSGVPILRCAHETLST